MNRQSLRVFLANLAWLLACLPGWLAFRWAARNVRRAQLAIFRRILKENGETDFGKAHGFARMRGAEDFQSIPESEYEDYAGAVAAVKAGRGGVLTAEPVELLQPTSGSTAATKLIPYTRALRAEFRAAVEPWIASMYLGFPSLLWGRHYWSISPATPVPADAASRVRIGFADDAEYLGGLQRWLARILFAVPAEISKVTDPEAFEYLTLLFLLREKNLRMISVWHPSFLTVLLRALPKHYPAILDDLESGGIGPELALNPELRRALSAGLTPAPGRAGELRRIDPAASGGGLQAIWPRLRLISCWTDGIAEPWVTELAQWFPGAVIQGKGLTATEGIVSFPWGKGGEKVCAVRSHFLEFVDCATGETKRAWEVEAGREYGVLLTTGGGLYRYRLHDVVRVTGFFGGAPCLTFLGRDNLVSDLVGEKLNARHVEESLREVGGELWVCFRFGMLAPHREEDRAGYVLYVELEEGAEADFSRMAALMEAALSRNYHYRHARRLGQLEPLRIFRIAGDGEGVYRRRLMSKGMKSGEIKFQALSRDTAWGGVFAGAFAGPGNKVGPLLKR